MKLSIVLAACLLTATAWADEPSTAPTTTTEDPGSPGADDPGAQPAPSDPEPDPEPEPAPAPPPSETPPTPAPTPSTPSHAPGPKPRARLAVPHTHAVEHLRVHDDGEGRLEKTEDEVAGGRHWRIKTAEGAVHVWVPDGYDRATAGTVIYVHGYYTDADGAWRDHELARQFRRSRQNAMFIVPDAPAGNDEPVNWPALKDLRHTVARANIRLPDGPVIVMGHSGAFRTIMQWVDHHLVEQIILLDAMYAGESAFDEYIDSGKRADEHKLIVVGASTAQESAGFAHKYKFAVAREKVPATAHGFTKRERRAKLLYIHSQYDHMAIVTSGKVIPVLLHLTHLKAL